MQLITALGPNRQISSVSAGADAVITTATPHGLAPGDQVTISGVAGTGGIEAINGRRPIVIVSTTAFTVGFNSTGMTHTPNTGEVAGPPTGGTFKLQFGADTTTALPYNATAAEVQAALAALPSIGVNPSTHARAQTCRSAPAAGASTGSGSGMSSRRWTRRNWYLPTSR